MAEINYKERMEDASRKLETVYALLDELERDTDEWAGNPNVSIELVRALLQATRTTLKDTAGEDDEI